MSCRPFRRPGPTLRRRMTDGPLETGGVTEMGFEGTSRVESYTPYPTGPRPLTQNRCAFQAFNHFLGKQKLYNLCVLVTIKLIKAKERINLLTQEQTLLVTTVSHNCKYISCEHQRGEPGGL